MRMLSQNVGKPRRGAEQKRDEADEIRILPQQRQEAAPAAQAGEKMIESGKGRIRVFRKCELIDDDRHKLGQILPRLLAAQGAISRRVPAPHSGHRLAGVPKANLDEAIKRLTFVLKRPEREVLLLREQGRRTFEQSDIVFFDRAQLCQQGSGEIVTAGEAKKSGEGFEPSSISRQCVGLLVGHHLQPMLDASEKIISGRQLVACLGVDPAAGGERVQRRHRLTAAQRNVAPAGDELLRLHEKFNLANAAAAELDVMALDRDLAVPAIGVDLLLHRVHVGDRRVVEIFAPDERRQLAEKPVAGLAVAGAGPRFDQRGTLPVLSPAFVIIEGRLG